MAKGVDRRVATVPGWIATQNACGARRASSIAAVRTARRHAECIGQRADAAAAVRVRIDDAGATGALVEPCFGLLDRFGRRRALALHDDAVEGGGLVVGDTGRDMFCGDSDGCRGHAGKRAKQGQQQR